MNIAFNLLMLYLKILKALPSSSYYLTAQGVLYILTISLWIFSHPLSMSLMRAYRLHTHSGPLSKGKKSQDQMRSMRKYVRAYHLKTLTPEYRGGLRITGA